MARPTRRSLVLRAQPERPLTGAQRTFNRLVARIEKLRAGIERRRSELDAALVFHARHIEPRAQRVVSRRKDFVRALRPFLDDARLSKRDRQALRAILAAHVGDVIGPDDPADADLRELFEQIHGAGYDEVAGEQLDELRSEIESMFDDIGLDLDLSNLRPGMTDEDMAAAAAEMAESVRRQTERMRASPPPARPRTPREIQREIQAEARRRHLEDLRKTSVGKIYRQLAKVLHPDLEPDPDARRRKSVLMQELTAAHARNDLHALLRLELEWIHREETDVARLTDERLGAYNDLLEEQAADLRQELNALPYHPKYGPLVVPDGPFGGMRVELDGRADVRQLDAVIDGLEQALARLGAGDALQEVRDLIFEHRQHQEYRWEDAFDGIRISPAGAAPRRRRQHRRPR